MLSVPYRIPGQGMPSEHKNIPSDCCKSPNGRRRIDRHNFIGIRTEFYDDLSGQRTGYQTGIFEATIGWNHYFSDDIYVRPELGQYHALNMNMFDVGKKRDMTMFAMDMIVRY